MLFELYEHQKVAIARLKTGSILCGGIGSGKSLTSLVYYYEVECGGEIGENGPSEMKTPKDLFIITTAHKRDTLDWERECAMFPFSRERSASISGVRVMVDSWNNISKYIKIKDAFFIFDEQRIVGSGSWVKNFLKIARQNHWILLSATPGDTWMDYVPVFVANGFYKNLSEFKRTHVVYNSWTKYPKIDHYVEEGRLLRYKYQVTVMMSYAKQTVKHSNTVMVEYDNEKFEKVTNRWNPYTNMPIKDVGEFFNVMRKVVNSDRSRLEAIRKLMAQHKKIIIFYNYNYELDILRELKGEIDLAEHNGHKHEALPTSDSWVYLVQYISGSEGWNCIETNAIVFYSQNYSYRMMTQAAGRIDRINTKFTDLYYYTLRSSSKIDIAISKSLSNKKDFNERAFLRA